MRVRNSPQVQRTSPRFQNVTGALRPEFAGTSTSRAPQRRRCVSLDSALMTAVLADCNTVMRGTEETVTITTRPASARIWTSLGQGCPQSPCTVRVDRKTEFTAHAAARGYQPGSLVVAPKLTSQAAPGVVGNAIIPGGSVGLVVDVATGAMLDHTPNPAHIDLVPIKRTRQAR